MPKPNRTFRIYNPSIAKYFEEHDPWIVVAERHPETDGEIVFMYSKGNDEYSCGHFVLSRAEVSITHWQPLIPSRGSRFEKS